MKRSRIREYSIFYAVLLIILIGDQITKSLASMQLADRAIVILPDRIFLSYARNTGAAWSIFQGNGLLLGIVGIFVLIMIFISRKHLDIKERSNQVIYGMVCAGTLGNVIDRLLRGHVVDFIDVRFGKFYWPVFNVADASICCGIFLCFLFTFLPKKKREQKSTFF